MPVDTKHVFYRGGLVVFSIPRDWIEEYEPEGGGMFFAEGEDTGTLRLNVTTFSSPRAITADSAREFLATLGLPVETLQNGNALATRVTKTTDQGQKIVIYSWHLSGSLAPETIRLANFTYTVLASMTQSSATVNDLAFIEASIRHATFSSEHGVIPPRSN